MGIKKRAMVGIIRGNQLTVRRARLDRNGKFLGERGYICTIKPGEKHGKMA